VSSQLANPHHPRAGDAERENWVALNRFAPYYSIAPERFIMADQERQILQLESQFPAASGSAFAAAREQVLASGQSVLQSEQGFIYEVFPDGRRLVVKQIEPPTPVVAGCKIIFR
jgi:hypothetical protein